MKKVKLFLLSAAIVAAGSAFISKPPAPEYVKTSLGWELKSMASGICTHNQDTHCTFTLNPGAIPPYQDSDFTPDDQNRIWKDL